jgi:hypothetical protein
VKAAPDQALDRAYELLRRELVRAQARLKRAERERDRALAEAARLRLQLRDQGAELPAAAAPPITRRPSRS